MVFKMSHVDLGVDWLGAGGAPLGPSGTWTGIVRELNDFGTSHTLRRGDLSNADMSICETTRWQNPLVLRQMQFSSRSFGRSRGYRNFDTRDSGMIISWPYPRSSTWQASPGMVQEKTWIALAYASCDAEAGRIEMVLNGGREACSTYHLPCIGHALRPAKIPLIQTRDTLKIDGPPIDCF